MLWSTLFNKLGKQPLANTQHHHVHAILRNSKTGENDLIFLDIKFDYRGRPYLVAAENQNRENPHKPAKPR